MKYIAFPIKKIILLVVFGTLSINVFAQDFSKLVATSKQERIFFADILQDKTLTLYNFDSKLRLSNELDFDTLVNVLNQVDSVFSSLILYNKAVQPVQKLQFHSSQDSIFIYQNFIIRQEEKEIVLFGTLLTPKIKTRIALWLNFDLHTKHKVVYDNDLRFYIKNRGIGSHFIVNNKGNIVTNVNGSSVELSPTGVLIKKSKYLLGMNYFQSKNLDYLSPVPGGMMVSDSSLSFVGFEENEALSLEQEPYNLSYKFKYNLIADYVLYHSTTLFDFDCESGHRNLIVKYNTNNYSSELFYIDSISNCKKKQLVGDFSLNYFVEDYIFTVSKHPSCGFINLDIDGENICNTEFIEVQCINKNGELRWRKELGGDASYLPNGIVATPDSGCVVFTNRYEKGINTGRESDLYYIKLDKNGNKVEPIPVNIQETEIEQPAINIYPNPVKNILYINQKNQSAKNLAIGIYDIQGKIIFSGNVENGQIALQHLTSGYYAYVLKTKQQTIKSGKLFKL